MRMLSLVERDSRLIVFAAVAIAAGAFLLLGAGDAAADDAPALATGEASPEVFSVGEGVEHIAGGSGVYMGTVTPTPVPLGTGAGMNPNSPPFVANVDIAPHLNDQTNPQVAIGPLTGNIYVAFTNDTGATRDVYVKISTDNGTTWTQYAVAANVGYDEFYPSIHAHFQGGTAEHVTMFYAQTNNVNQACWYHADSDDLATWTNFCMTPSFGGINPDNFRFSSQASYGTLSYVMFDVQDMLSGGAYTVFWAWTDDSWHTGTFLAATAYFGTTGADFARPSVLFNKTLYEGDMSDGSPDGCMAFALEVSDPALIFGGGGWDGTADTAFANPHPFTQPMDPACSGSHSFYLSQRQGSMFDNAGDFHPSIVDLGVGGAAYAFTFDQADADIGMLIFYGDNTFAARNIATDAGRDYRYPALYGENGLILAVFVRDELGAYFSYSLNYGDTWSTEMEVSDNPPGTAVPGFHSIAVAHTDRVHVIWQDNRDGDVDIYYSTITGFRFTRVTRSPEIDNVRVDGTNYTAPRVSYWAEAEVHNLSVWSPTPDPANPTRIRYVFNSWSDGGAQSHDITVGSTDVTYTAYYRTQYWITFTTAFGNVSPPSGWFDEGDVVNFCLTLPGNTADTRYIFTNWTSNGIPGNYEGPLLCASLIALGPIEETALVTREFLVVVTSPYGTPFCQTRGCNAFYPEGSIVNISVPTPVAAGPGIRFNFWIWSGNGGGHYDGANNPVNIVVIAPITETAVWNTEFELALTTTAGTLLPGANTWHVQGSTASISAFAPAVGPGERWNWGGWTGTPNLPLNPTSLLMNGPKTYNAVWTHQYYLDTATNFGTVTCTPTPCGWINALTVETVTANAPPPGVGLRYTFGAWTGWGAGSSNATTNVIVLPALNNHIQQTARWIREFQVTITVNNGITSPGSGWFADGTTVAITAIPPAATNTERYASLQWNGTNPGSYTGPNNPAVITITGSPITEVGTWTHQYYLDVRVDTPGSSFVCIPAGSPGPCGWYAAGAVVQIQAVGPFFGSGERYVFEGWTGTGTGNYTGTANPTSVSMGSGILQAGGFRHEYEVSLSRNLPQIILNPPAGWYLADTQITLASTSPSTATGERFVFLSWMELLGSPPISGNPVVVLMNGPKYYEAQWAHEYALTVSANFATVACNPGPCGWYASGTPVMVTATAFIPGSGEQYRWVGWEGTGTGNYSGTQLTPSVVMNAAILERAVFAHEFNLIVNSPFGSPVGSGWWAEGTTAVVSVTTPVLTSSDTRQVFTAWSGAIISPSPAVSIYMDSSKVLIASWTTQYLLTVDSLYGNPIGADWYDEGDTASFSVVAAVYSTASDRWAFTDWTGDVISANAAETVFMDAPKSVTANWQREYLLTVVSPYATMTGAGWWTSGTNAAFSVSTDTVPIATGVQQAFTRWTGDAAGTSIAGTVNMNGPKTVTATWQLQYRLIADVAQPVPTPVVTTSPACTSSSPCWYDAGATQGLALGSPTLSVGTGDRWRFSGWSGTTTAAGSGSLSLTMDRPQDLTGLWVHEYQITVTFSPAAVTPPVSVDGSATPAVLSDLWVAAGASHRLAVPAGYTNPADSKPYLFEFWTGTGLSAAVEDATVTVTLAGPGSYVVTYAEDLDTDRDLLPDAWERQFFDNLESTALEDPDHDLLINLEEYRQNKDPTKPEVSSFVDALVANPILLILLVVLLVIIILLAILYKRKSRPVQVVEEAEMPPPAEPTYAPPPAAPEPEVPAPPPPMALPAPPTPALAPPAAPVPAAPAAPEAPASKADTVECPTCGIINDASQQACAVCGEKLPQNAPGTPAKLEKLQAAYRSGRITKEQYEANLRKLQGS